MPLLWENKSSLFYHTLVLFSCLATLSPFIVFVSLPRCHLSCQLPAVNEKRQAWSLSCVLVLRLARLFYMKLVLDYVTQCRQIPILQHGHLTDMIPNSFNLSSCCTFAALWRSWLVVLSATHVYNSSAKLSLLWCSRFSWDSKDCNLCTLPFCTLNLYYTRIHL